MSRTSINCPWGHALTPAKRKGRKRECRYCNTVRSYAQKRGVTLGEYYAKHPRMVTEYFTHMVSTQGGFFWL